ncbi:hypothetical protein AVEN_21043-1 [Araneus ventricosus]|uniref:Uncharacterized protein n=1 Tax=Araneus ventricosus TaxID=182803 RepID=A0A4Y2H4D5_ARAVE|nr:hypothetical protein AVEN_21043-1 [Araneus ventricosus]
MLPTRTSFQTALSRFVSGHLRSCSFSHGNKVFPVCAKCGVASASPEHILSCLRLSRETFETDPLLALDFLRLAMSIYTTAPILYTLYAFRFVDDCSPLQTTDSVIAFQILIRIEHISHFRILDIQDVYYPEESAEEDVSRGLVSRANSANGLEVALRYGEQHTTATPTDVVFMRRFRKIPSSRRFSSLRQE